MDEIIRMLEDICPSVDIRTCDTLVDDGVLDSFAENFNSAQEIWNMVQRLQDE
jgi:hypothetical protein